MGTLGGMTELRQMTDSQIQELPIDQLGLFLLEHCDVASERKPRGKARVGERRSGACYSRIYDVGLGPAHVD